MLLKCLSAIAIVNIFIYPLTCHAADKDISCGNCNVILISIDTMRADRLGSAGYFRKITPNLDRLAKDGVVFNTHIAQAPSTAPSHASIFTSLIPASHGAFVKRKSAIKENLPTLTEILKANGYATVSFNGGGQLDSKFGFNRGFDTYKSFTGSDYTVEKMSDRATEGTDWIRSNPGKKFFLFLHSYDIHVPYAPEKSDLDKIIPAYKGNLTLPITSDLLKPYNSKKKKISEEDRKFIEAAYDAEILSADRDLKVFFDFLKENKLYENTLIILTSDHGEEFGEHGHIGLHSHTLFDELIRVPLIIKFPNQTLSGTVINKQTRSIDLAPTVLDVVNIKSPETFQGKSLVRLSKSNGSEEFESYAVSQKDREANLPTSVRSKEWKLYNKLLFNLKTDPREQKNIAGENKSVTEEFKKQMDEVRKLDVPSEKKEVEIGNESFDQLKTLGYL